MTNNAPRLPDRTVTLSGGARIPLLGFGTWQIKGQDAVRATSAALATGYRHLDTATVYGNEGEVGRALAGSGVPRDHVFLTTKCPPGRTGQELDILRESLELLQTDHVVLIEQAMNRLPTRYQELLALRELEGLSYQELAARLDIPMGTVMSSLSRARQALRAALDDQLEQYNAIARSTYETSERRI